MTEEKLDVTHIDYDNNINIWTKINDICDGNNLANYLIKLNPLDDSPENVIRNKQYYERAIFYNIAGYTIRGMVGMLFRKNPSLNIDNNLEYIKSNIDGTGLNIYQQSQAVCENVIKTGRCGLWVDFPKTDGNISKADLKNLNVFSTVKKFKAEQIINWDVEVKGAHIKLSRVLLKYIEVKDNENIEVILDLSIDNDIYRVKKWVNDNTSSQWELDDDYYPIDGYGEFWDFIPFQFVGSNTNNYKVDDSPSIDIVRVNIGHWNNSASYEDTLFYAGIIQPWMSGVSEEYVQLLKDNNMYVGSGRLIGVPTGESFGFAQAKPNIAVKDAMNDKIEMMIGLGAMFFQPGSAVKTATQSGGEQEMRHSILSLLSVNVSNAYTNVISWMSRYMRIDSNDLNYELNKEFTKPNATSADLKEIVVSFLQGVLPFSDYISWCQKYGYIDESKSIEDVTEELKNQKDLIEKTKEKEI